MKWILLILAIFLVGCPDTPKEGTYDGEYTIVRIFDADKKPKSNFAWRGVPSLSTGTFGLVYGRQLFSDKSITIPYEYGDILILQTYKGAISIDDFKTSKTATPEFIIEEMIK